MNQRGYVFYPFLALVAFVLFSSQATNFRTLSALDWNQQGQEALESRRFYDAIENFLEAIRMNEQYKDSYVGLVEAYVALHQPQEALFYIDKIVALTKEAFPLQELYGRVLFQLGRFDEAQARFEDVLRMTPHNIKALWGMAELNKRRGNAERALEYYQRALNLDPSSLDLALGLLDLYSRQQRFEEGRRLIVTLASLHSNSPDFSYRAALFFFSMAQYEQAEEHALHFIRINNMLQRYSPYAGLELLARIQLRRGEYELAYRSLEDALRQDPRSSFAYYLLAISFLRQRQIPQAVEYFHRAWELSLNQDQEEFYRLALLTHLIDEDLNLLPPVRQGLVSFYQKEAEDLMEKFRFQRAFEYSWIARSILPADSQVRFLLARVYKSLGWDLLSLADLSFLKQQSYRSEIFEDMLSVEETRFERHFAQKWNLKNIDDLQKVRDEKPRLQLAIFTLQDSRIIDQDEVYSRYAEFILDTSSYYEIVNHSSRRRFELPYRQNRYSEAYALARDYALDFFLILDFSVNYSGGLSLDARLYRGDTGVEIQKFRIDTLSARPMERVAERLKSFLDKTLSPFGQLIRRTEYSALVNMGKVDGLGMNSELIIVRKTDFPSHLTQDISQIPPARILGRATIKQISDFFSELELQPQYFLDQINFDSLVLPLPSQGVAIPSGTNSPNP